MCGIVSYNGKRQVTPLLLDGLHKLEYRGYDSAGIAVMSGTKLRIQKSSGRVQELQTLVDSHVIEGTTGIAHTRWATHGAATVQNAHPHMDQSGRLALVHNGVIENYAILKNHLEELGHVFISQTDTEVLAHLIGDHYNRSEIEDTQRRLYEALRSSLKLVKGSYSVAIMHQDCPNYLLGARLGSPLLLGIGKNEWFLSSDVSVLVAHTRDVIYLNDYDIVSIHAQGYEIRSLAGELKLPEICRVDIQANDSDKGSFEHFMLKEIHDQPKALQSALQGRLDFEEATAIFDDLSLTSQELRQIERVIFTGCGSASYAGMIGKSLMESLARMPSQAEIASEFRYRNAPVEENTLQFFTSQSGETIDTLSALRESKRKGIPTVSIINTVASTISRESDDSLYLHAGPEIGVAATKSFTSQIMVMTLLALQLGRMRHLSHAEGLSWMKEIESIPEKIEQILKQSGHIKRLAEKYAASDGMLFMGRLNNYPVALEAALKMKEISYIYASGHPSAELKHGVIAMIKPELPSVFIAPNDSVLQKNISNIEEVKARKGPIVAVTTEGVTALNSIVDDLIFIPKTRPELNPLLTVIPMQLFAYYVALARGCNVDKPRNLAKSVTVE